MGPQLRCAGSETTPRATGRGPTSEIPHRGSDPLDPSPFCSHPLWGSCRAGLELLGIRNDPGHLGLTVGEPSLTSCAPNFASSLCRPPQSCCWKSILACPLAYQLFLQGLVPTALLKSLLDLSAAKAQGEFPALTVLGRSRHLAAGLCPPLCPPSTRLASFLSSFAGSLTSQGQSALGPHPWPSPFLLSIDTLSLGELSSPCLSVPSVCWQLPNLTSALNPKLLPAAYSAPLPVPNRPLKIHTFKGNCLLPAASLPISPLPISGTHFLGRSAPKRGIRPPISLLPSYPTPSPSASPVDTSPQTEARVSHFSPPPLLKGWPDHHHLDYCNGT